MVSDDIVIRLRYQRTNSVLCAEAADEIERLRADRDRWRSLANHLIRDLEFRTDPTAANFIVQQMVARIDRERALRGE